MVVTQYQFILPKETSYEGFRKDTLYNTDSGKGSLFSSTKTLWQSK